MSATPWIGASQVMRSRWGRRMASVSSGELRVLDPGLRKRLDHAAVEDGVGGLIDDRAHVQALEVDRVDRAGGHQAGDDLGRPLGGRVELEAQRRVALQALGHGVEGRRLAQAQRDDEAHRVRLAAERGVQRRARLAQREVERRRLVGPHAIEARGLALGRRGPQVEGLDVIAERPQRPFACEGQDRAGRLQDLVVGRVVGHVLADALLAGAVHADDRRDAREGRRDVAGQALQGIALDVQRQVGEALLEQAHGARTLCTARLTWREMRTCVERPANSNVPAGDGRQRGRGPTCRCSRPRPATSTRGPTTTTFRPPQPASVRRRPGLVVERDRGGGEDGEGSVLLASPRLGVPADRVGPLVERLWRLAVPSRQRTT
jgi:hypothetical protein